MSQHDDVYRDKEYARAKPLLDSLGSTYPQYLVLGALWEEDCRTITAIAERLALEPSTITPLVKARKGDASDLNVRYGS